MAVVKLDALTNLKAAIATAIPSLAASSITITTQMAPSGQDRPFPNLEIILPSSMVFDPAQRLEQADLGGNVVVWNVGAHEGPLQLRLTTTTPNERYATEQALIDMFMSSDGAPGILLVEITDASQSLLQWVAAFEYTDSTWDDTRSFEREFQSVITVNAVIPALVTESEVYEIDTLVCGLTNDMINNPPTGVELVQINADGSITPYSG